MTWQNSGAEIGDTVEYAVAMDFRQAGMNQKFTNFMVVDLLPDGITLRDEVNPIKSITNNWRFIKNVELVDNYLNSGRRALLIYHEDFSVGDLGSDPTLTIRITGKINDKATTKFNPEAVNDNKNYIYFVSDELINENERRTSAGLSKENYLIDTFDIDQDGLKNDNIAGSTSNFVAILPQAVRGMKSIRAYNPDLPENEQNPWSKEPIFTNYDGEFQYKVSTINDAVSDLRGLYIYDRLPHPNDYEYIYRDKTYVARHSAFEPLMTGPIVNPDPDKFTIEYRTDNWIPPGVVSAWADRDLWRSEAEMIDEGNWESVNAFRIYMNDVDENGVKYVIPGYQTVDFIVPMKAPSYVYGNHLNRQMANNNFAISYDGTNWGQSNIVSNGLVISIPVKKQWNGGDPADHIPVEVEVQRRIKGSGTDFESVPSGNADKTTLWLNADNVDANGDWINTFVNLPVLSTNGKEYEYTVIERNTSENYEPTTTGNSDDGFTITNTFVSPQIRIRGTKIWDGGPDHSGDKVALQLYRWVGDGDLTNGPDGAADPLDEFDDNGIILKEALGTVHYVTSDPHETPDIPGVDDPGWSSSKFNDQYRQSDGAKYNFIIREVRSPFTILANPELYSQEVTSEFVTADKTPSSFDELQFEIKNTFNPPAGDIIASKIWVGGDYSYPQILLDLYRHKEGQQPEDAEKVVDGVSSATTNLSPYRVYKDMVLMDQKDGMPYVYRIEEVDLTKLTPEERTQRGITQADVDEYANYVAMRNYINDPRGVNDPDLSIINTYVSPRLVVEGTKAWVGGDVTDRPDVKFQLMQNGVKYEPKATLIGTGVPGSLISVDFGTTQNLITKVHPDGKWYIEYDQAPIAGTLLTLRQTEIGKPASDEVNYTIGDAPIEAGSPINAKSATPGITSFETPANPIVLKPDEKAVWDVPRTDFFEQAYNYQVREVEVPENYTDSYSDPVEERDEKGKLIKLTQEVTNTYTPDTIRVTANKEWEGGPIEKPGYEFQLYRTTEADETTKTAVGAPVALLTQTSQSWDVPEKDADGNLYTYFVEETTAPTHYTPSYKMENGVEDKLTIVNTFTPDDLTIPVQKVWMGGSLEERPDTVSVSLYNGDVLATNDVGEPLTLILDQAGEWMGEFTNVPAVDGDLNPINYTVKEVDVQGFTVSYEGDQGRGFRVINTYTPATADVSAVKEWIGGTHRPSVELELIRNGVPMGEDYIITLNGDIDEKETAPWVATWKALPVKDMTGTDYVYTVREVQVPQDYIVSYDGLKVINTYVSKPMDFTATKVWEGGPQPTPTAVFQLYRQVGADAMTKEAVDDRIFVKDDVHTWTDLPVTDHNGVPYAYWVEEENIPENYTSVRGEVLGNTQVITNTYHAPKADLVGRKVWVGGPDAKPDIALILERRVGEAGTKEDVEEALLVAGDPDVIWKDMPLNDDMGNPYIYSVREKNVPENYTVSYNGMTAINTYAISRDGEVEGKKIWEDGPAKDRPVIYLELYRQVGTGTPERVPGTDNLKVEISDGETEVLVKWTDLEMKDANGNDYIFSMREVGTPKGYTKTEDGLNVTNKYIVGTTAFTATKKWVGGGVDKPTVGLVLSRALASKPGVVELVDNHSLAPGETTHRWIDLPKTDTNGEAYLYSVDEVAVPAGYVKEVGDVTYTLFGEGRQTLTNTQETKDLTFTKNWIGGPDTKPSITVGVRANGEMVTDVNGKVMADIILPNGTVEGTFNNLPTRDGTGKVIDYAIVETRIGNEDVIDEKAGSYEVTIGGTTITNTYVPEKTTIDVEKAWIGGERVRPEEVTVQLFRKAGFDNKEFVGETATLTETGQWKHQWTDLEASNAKGQSYTYTVEEINAPVNFTSAVTGDGTKANPFVITNTYTENKTDVTAYKKWVGGSLEKPEIELMLYRKTDAMAEAEPVPAGLPLIGLQNPIAIVGGDVSHTWKNLPVADNAGNPYDYTVIETKIDGVDVVDGKARNYTVTYDGMVVNNTYGSDDHSVHAKKVWVGGMATDHVAPELVLYQNGKALTAAPIITPDTTTATAFIYRWDVPKTDAYGQDYTYTVDEADTPIGYGKSVEVDGEGKTIITNTYDAKVTDISVHKDWVGGTAPYPPITLELQRKIGNGDYATVATEILLSGDHIHIWKGQPLQDDRGEDYDYRVIETSIGNTPVVDNQALNYNVTYSGDVAGGFTVTNTSVNNHEITVTKVWDDNDNARGKRPDRITLIARRDDGVEKAQVFDVIAENQYTIIGLEKFKPNSTEAYSYTIDEVAVAGYATKIAGTTVTNTFEDVEKTAFTLTKEWIGGPEKKPTIGVQLYQRLGSQGEEEAIKLGDPVVLDNTTTYTWKDLSKTDDKGEAYIYTADETSVPAGYVKTLGEVSYTFNGEGRQTMTNAMKTAEIDVTKVWVDGPEAKPDVVIGVRDPEGNQVVDVMGVVVRDVTLKNGTTETAFNNLPLRDSAGDLISYHLVESSVGGVAVVNGVAGNYEVTIDGNRITNTYRPEKITIDVAKVWEEVEEKTPEGVNVQLFRRAPGANKEFVGELVALNGTNDWKHRWTDLEKTSTTGVIYDYAVEEIDVPTGYRATVRGSGSEADPFIITNTFDPNKTDVIVYKNWRGGPDVKPEVEMTLYRSTDGGVKEVVPTGLPLIGVQNPITLRNGDISYKWTNLPVTDPQGARYAYSIEETELPDYVATYEGMMVINTYTNTTSLEITKVWKDENHATRPHELIFMVTRNDGEVVRKIFDTDMGSDRATYVFDGLAKNDEHGKPYTYTIDEASVPGYGKSVDQETKTITNTLTGKTDISVRKQWRGVETPENYTANFQLVANGEEIPEATLVIRGDGADAFKDLQAFDENGEAIDYTVREINVPEGFETTVTENSVCGCDYVFTNTNTVPVEPGVGRLSFTKLDGITQEPLEGAVFELRSIDDNIAAVEAGSDATGVVTFDKVSEGTYLLTEKRAPEGYLLAHATFIVKVDRDGVVTLNGEPQDSASIANFPEESETYTVVLQKTDETNRVLEAAEFDLYDDTNEKVGSYTTNSQGLIVVEALKAGEYHFSETKAPQGYTIDGDGEYTFVVPEADGTPKTALVYAKNTAIPTEKTDVAVHKVWVGEEETHPTITLRLMDGNDQVAFATLEHGVVDHSFTNLEKYRADQVTEIVYTLKEDPVPGYTTEINGLTAINTKIVPPIEEPETIEIKGEKVWIGGSDEKPTIELQLFQNGEIYGDPVTLANGITTHVWSDLPKVDLEGKDYVYTVDEVNVPEGYEKVPHEGTVVINAAKRQTTPAETTQVTGTKIWVGAPEDVPDIQLQLKRNGMAYGEPVTLSEGNTRVDWSELPLKDEQGEAYRYTVDEVEVPEGYVKTLRHDTIVINTKEEEPIADSISFTGTKIWIGAPEIVPEIEMILLQNGEPHGDPVLLKSGVTSLTWTQLPAKDPAGKAYTYTVDEVAVPEDYLKTLYLNVIVNTYKNPVDPPIKETVDITGIKKWVNTPDATPEIQLMLLRNGVAFGDPVTLAKGTTTHTWTDLDKTDANGDDYIYTIDEVQTPEHYEKVLVGTIVINIYKPVEEPVKEVVQITGRKVWLGGPEKRPVIELQLKQNGVNYGEPVALNGETEHTWTDLPKADNTGKAYVYTVDEVAVPAGYTKVLAGTTVINRYESRVPEQPTDPEKPEDPKNPTKPEDPTKPVDPTKPTDPAIPVNPIDPVDSVKPTPPKKPTVKPTPATVKTGKAGIKSTNPNTGDPGIAVSVISVIGGLSALIGISAIKRKKDEA